MQSFYTQFNDFRRKKQLHIIAAAFILALGANILTFSPVGLNIQASITDLEEQGYQANIQAIKSQDMITLKTLTPLEEITSFHTTLLYNPEKTSITNIQSI